MTVKKLSVFTERMMPDFVSRDHEQFTKFIKYYFEFLEQTDGVYDYAANSLEYMDIDYTKNSLLEEFRNTYLLNFPGDTDVDVRFLVKHIREFYQSKGSEKSYEFLFRLLYGDDEIDIYYPKLDILRCSDGKWNEANQDWDNTDGFLSSDKKLQDNYYYQDFSYEIITDVTRYYYENVVHENIHISGQLMFGRNIIQNETPISMEWLDFDKYDRLDTTDLGLNLLWGGGYTVSQTEKNSESILVDVNGGRVVETIEYPFLSIAGAYNADDVIGIRRLDNALADNETFTANGVQTTFTLDNTYTANQLLVWDGQTKMYEGVDFSISGNDIIFTTAPTVKVYVLKHTQESRELISGTGDVKYITLTDHPQGYLLNKIIVFANGVIVDPEWYDPLTKRVYFNNYVPEGTNNIEVVHMEALGYVDHVTIIDSITKYNLSANKNEFRQLPTQAYVTLVVPGDDIRPKLDDNITSIWVFVTPSDEIKLSLIERTAILLTWIPTTETIVAATTDTISTGGSDIEFAFPSTITSTSTDLSIFTDGNSITVAGSTSNNGTYTVSGVPTENTLLIVESALSPESAGAAVTITATGTGYDYADANPDSITTSVAKWGNVLPSDRAVVSGSASNDGEYLILDASPTTLTLYDFETLVTENDDTTGTIQIIREIVTDRIYPMVEEVYDAEGGKYMKILVLWDITDDVLIDPDIDANTPVTDSTQTETDDIRPKIDDTINDITATNGAGTVTDDVKPKITEGTTSILQTTEETDISFTATSTISTVAGDFTVFDDTDSITVVTTSGTNDGTYTISGTPTTSTITISETTLTTEDAATAGTVSISRTV